MTQSAKFLEFQKKIHKGNYPDVLEGILVRFYCDISKFSYNEQLELIDVVHNFYINKLDKDIQSSKKSISELENMNNQDLQKFIDGECKEIKKINKKKKGLEKQLQENNRLKELLKENQNYSFEVGKVYEVTDWDGSFMGDTGHGASGIESSHLKIVENSKFVNEYDCFFFGITSGPYQKSKDNVSFIRVTPTKGYLKGYWVLIPMDKIKTN